MKLIEEYVPKGLSGKRFWELLVVYNGNVRYIPLNILWQYISIPLISNENETWIKISDLPKLTLHQNEDKWHFVTIDNQKVKLPLSLAEWEKSGVQTPTLQSQINTVILAMSALSIREDRVVLNVCLPDDELITAAFCSITGDMTCISTLRYTNNAKDFLTVQAPVKTANSSHPLVQECLKVHNSDALSKFASSFIRCIVDIICSKKQERSFAKPDRWMKFSAHCYFAVDWSKYQNSQLKPPYKIWLENDEIFEITENDMQKWRDSKIKNMD